MQKKVSYGVTFMGKKVSYGVTFQKVAKYKKCHTVSLFWHFTTKKCHQTTFVALFNLN